MVKKWYILGMVLCVGLAVSCGREAKRLNVLIIAVDTLRPDHLGCYGYERQTSPNIDGFARTGVLCENTVSQAPWTLPSFATVFTSLYPTQHGAMVVKSHMRESFPTLASILKDHGYATGAIVNAPALKPLNRVDRGFDYYSMTPPDGRIADGTTSDALDWIDGVNAQPFFMFAHYFDPHLPYSPPPPFTTQFDPEYEGRIGDSFNLEGFSRVRSTMFEQLKELTPADWNHIVSLYDGEIGFTDLAVRDFLAGLEERNLIDNTLIVFLSDHGEEFFEHQGFEHGHSLYKEIIRVPLIFSLPSVLPENARLARQVRLLDVAPTILDLVGLDAPLNFEGVSLKPLLEGTGIPTESEPKLLAQDIAYSEALMHGSEQKCVAEYPWKLVLDVFSKQEVLFNLKDDPGETRNLIEIEPAVTTRLEQHLYETLFDISDTWYMELAAGDERHTFDIEIKAEKGLMLGTVTLYKLLDSNGKIVPTEKAFTVSPHRSVLKVQGLELSGRATLALKIEPDRIPVRFNLAIDGRSAIDRTFTGSSLANPDEMPFIRKPGRAKVKSDGRPSGDLSAPYCLLWHSEGHYRGDTSIKLDEQTRKELKALGYIQ
jgi:arylsulfatase A-like enzyme